MVSSSSSQILILSATLLVAATLPTKSLTFSPGALQRLHPTQKYATFTSLRSTPTNDDNDEEEEEDGYFPLDDNSSDGDFIFSTPSLGINIGAELGPLTPEEAAQIKAEASAMIEETFASRLDEIENVKKVTRKKLEEDARTFAIESEARAKAATDQLMNKIDKLSNDFLEENEALRMGTKMAAMADQESAVRGEGVDVGSWGRLSDGREVLTAAGGAVGGAALLGSVESAVQDAEKKKKQKQQEMEDLEKKGGSLMDMGDDVMKAFDDVVENRILVVCDEKKDASTKKLLDRFESLLSDAFASNIKIDRFSPTSNIPIGGLNAQVAILVTSSLNDRSSVESILGRILKRTALPDGKYGIPPSHIVCLSSLGTERYEEFPYNMQNLMGGKLEKRRAMEEAVVKVVQSRIPGVQIPLDYTIMKVGDVVEDEKAKKSGDLTIRPGDSLDGAVGIEAAANTLMQAVAFQPAARNATLSVIGGLVDKEAVDDETWDDSFLRLDGPELLRIENLAMGDEDVNRKFDELSEYIREWSSMFEGDAKGKGLTTPVNVGVSTMGPSAAERVVARSGVKITFKSTNTGAAYMSKDEERAAERERSGGSGGSSSSSSTPSRKKPKKEGGVEVLVEKTMGGELRVRARRCDMADDTVLKELSEGAILKKVQKGVDVWINQQGL